MEFNKAYPLRKQVPWRVIDVESLVVDVKAGLIYPLNSVATRIWQLCDGQRTVEEIVQIVAAEFETDGQTAREDTTGFIQELLHRELISLAQKSRPPETDRPGSRGPAAGG